MEVQTIVYEMPVPKEGKEVVDLIDAILEKVMAKAPWSSYTDLLDELMVAIDGVQHIGAEIKGEYRDELTGYLVHKVMSRLVPAEDASEAPAAPEAEQ